MKNVRRATLTLVATAIAAVAVVGGGTAASEQTSTVTIGWAYDGVGAMAPFDGPALATAKGHIATVNKRSATKLRLITCNTQGNKPAIAKACAAEAPRSGSRHHHDHLRRRLRCPGSARVDQSREADRRPVHRHRPDGTEALRGQGAACLLLRQRCAGRGLGDGGVRVEPWLAHCIARDGHGDRLLPQHRAGASRHVGSSSAGGSQRKSRISRSAVILRRGRASPHD